MKKVEVRMIEIFVVIGSNTWVLPKIWDLKKDIKGWWFGKIYWKSNLFVTKEFWNHIQQQGNIIYHKRNKRFQISCQCNLLKIIR